MNFFIETPLNAIMQMVAEAGETEDETERN